MKTIFSVKKSYNYLQAIITGRLSSAIEMLDMEDLLHTEQETDTTYSKVLSNLYTLMEKEGIKVDARIEYFRGGSDVIFEYSITFQEMKEPRPTHEICSEHIAGTVFLELFKHFGWLDWNAPEIPEDGYNSRDFKKLLAFKR